MSDDVERLLMRVKVERAELIRGLKVSTNEAFDLGAAWALGCVPAWAMAEEFQSRQRS